MKLKSTLLMITIPMSLLGCVNTPHQISDPAFASVRPVSSMPLPINDGAIYKSGYEIALFEDKKAKEIGDLITVFLSETTSSSKSASTNTTKDASVDIDPPIGLGRGITKDGISILENVFDGERSFKGEGDSSQSNSLYGTITVTVSEVFANGNLFIRGEKLLNLNQGNEFVRISGVVRPDDVSPTNTVQSSMIANAKIIYGGEGVIADSNSKGWLQRFFESAWWPF